MRGREILLADDGEPKWRSVHPAALKDLLTRTGKQQPIKMDPMEVN